jgi:hypothetical protein
MATESSSKKLKRESLTPTLNLGLLANHIPMLQRTIGGSIEVWSGEPQPHRSTSCVKAFASEELWGSYSAYDSAYGRSMRLRSTSTAASPQTSQVVYEVAEMHRVQSYVLVRCSNTNKKDSSGLYLYYSSLYMYRDCNAVQLTKPLIAERRLYLIVESY